MSAFDKELTEWWDRRSDEQRESLRAAAESGQMDAATVRLLVDTRCPVGPIATKWETQPDFSWQWPATVRQFIRAPS